MTLTAPSLFDGAPTVDSGEVEPSGQAGSLPATAAQAKADGIARADANADPWWKEAAYEATRFCAQHCDDFTADEVWTNLARRGLDVSTHNPAALGPVFQRAARAGLITKTGELRPSTNPRRHRDLTVWRAA